MEYEVFNISNIYEALGEERFNKMISEFKCDLNPDIEKFLKSKSINFSKRGITETFIVTTEYKQHNIIVGYFSLAYKITQIQKDILKGKIKNRLLRFVQKISIIIIILL